jgi:O-antigen/teichoic acid export membrane protein
MADFLKTIKKSFGSVKNNISKRSEFLWLILGQIISIIFSVVIIKIITKMGTSDFGIYSLILTISALVSAILVGPSEQGFVRYFFSFNKTNDKRRFLNVIYLFFITTGILIIFISILFYFFQIIKTPNSLLIGVFIVLFTFSSFFASLFNLIRKRKLNTFLIIGEKIISTLLLFALKFYGLLNINTVLIVLSFSIFVSIIVRMNYFNSVLEYKFFRDLKFVNLREYLIYKKIFIFSIPLMIWGFSGWLESSSDRWVIANFSNLNTVGVYSLMMTLSSYLIATPIGVIGQYFQPIIFENINNVNSSDGLKKAMDNFIYSCVGLVVLGVLFSLFFGRIILSFIAIDFTTFWYFLPFFSLSIGLFQIAQAYTIFGMIHEMPKIYLIPKIVLGVVSLILNVVGVYYLQIIGLTISMIVASSIYLVMVLMINRKFKSTL